MGSGVPPGIKGGGGGGGGGLIPLGGDSPGIRGGGGGGGACVGLPIIEVLLPGRFNDCLRGEGALPSGVGVRPTSGGGNDGVGDEACVSGESTFISGVRLLERTLSARIFSERMLSFLLLRLPCISQSGTFFLISFFFTPFTTFFSSSRFLR